MSAVMPLPGCGYAERAFLPDGSEVILRPLEPEDADLLLDVFDRLGPRSRELRFLTPKHRLSAADLRQLTAVDHYDHEAVVALSITDGRPLGVARFVRSSAEPDTADVAVVVVDAWQARGLGTVLTSSLLGRARELGIRRFSLLMARDNEAAVRLMHRVLGDAERVALDDDTAEFVASLTPPRGGPVRRLLKGVRR